MGRAQWARYRAAATDALDEVVVGLAGQIQLSLRDVRACRSTVVGLADGCRRTLDYCWFMVVGESQPATVAIEIHFDLSGWPMNVRVYVQNEATGEMTFESRLSKAAEMSADELSRRLRVMAGLVKPVHVLKALRG